MNTTTLPAYHWLKQVPTALLQLNGIPLINLPTPFPWEQLSSHLAKIFQIETLNIRPREFQWRTAQDLYSGIGEKSSLTPLHLTIPPLPGSICWVMPQRDIRLLMSELLIKNNENVDFLDPEFVNGFYHFLSYEVINAINAVPFDKDLTPHIEEQNDFPDTPSLCLDVEISLPKQVLHGRFIISPEMQKAWNERNAQRSLEVPLNSPLAEKLQVTVHLEGGHTSIKLSEWKQVNPGDFIVLDFCSLSPGEDKGRVMLTAHGIPLYRAKIKQGNIKILEQPLYHEVNVAMEKQPPENDEESSDFEGFENDTDTEGFEEEEDETIEETAEEETAEEETTEEETAEEETAEEETEEEEATEEEDAAEEETVEEETFEEDVSEEGETTEAEADKTEEAEKAIENKPKSLTQTKSKPTKVEEIPLSIIVEVGRIEMPIQQLMQLQPGNLLELDVHPENGVDLVLNGRRIAKGELLLVGETLGVRILDLI